MKRYYTVADMAKKLEWRDRGYSLGSSGVIARVVAEKRSEIAGLDSKTFYFLSARERKIRRARAFSLPLSLWGFR